jgi:predicted glutamine amidotransferase
MCRLFAYKSEKESDIPALSQALREFGALATTGNVPRGKEPGHRHGWGIVAYKDETVCHCARGMIPADEDPAYEKMIETLTELKPTLVIGHLRKATTGGVILNNVQPFQAFQHSFCHNGSIEDFPVIAEDASDSLSFFTNLVSNISRRSFTDYRGEVASTHSYTALNMLYCDGKKIVYSRDWNESHPQAEELGLGDYYALYMFKGDTQSFLCSQPLESFSSLEARLLDNKEVDTL